MTKISDKLGFLATEKVFYNTSVSIVAMFNKTSTSVEGNWSDGIVNKSGEMIAFSVQEINLLWECAILTKGKPTHGTFNFPAGNITGRHNEFGSASLKYNTTGRDVKATFTSFNSFFSKVVNSIG